MTCADLSSYSPPTKQWRVTMRSAKMFLIFILSFGLLIGLAHASQKEFNRGMHGAMVDWAVANCNVQRSVAFTLVLIQGAQRNIDDFNAGIKDGILRMALEEALLGKHKVRDAAIADYGPHGNLVPGALELPQ